MQSSEGRVRKYCGKDHRDLTYEDVRLFFRVVDGHFEGIYSPPSNTDAQNIARFINEGLPAAPVTPEDVGSLMRFLKNQGLTSEDFRPTAPA